MITELLQGDGEHTITKAAQILQSGGLVGLPTETVYGLGADGLNPEAVSNIFLAKGRPQDNPLILHIGKSDDLAKYCENIPQSAWDLAEAFWPGPLTMVLPARDVVPKITRANLDTVGVRCPAHDLTRAIILASQKPIAAPSANRSGKPSTTTASHVLADMDGRIDAVVDGGACSVGVESTIVDLTGDVPRLLRPGGITPEQLVEILGELDVDRAVLGQIDQDEIVRAPGMKYKHYAPDATVLIVDGDGESAAEYVRNHFQKTDSVLCFSEELELFRDFNPTAYGSLAQPETLARGLFSALRDLDGKGISTVYARCPQGAGVAYAVANRLKKAAAFTVVNQPPKPYIIGITGGTGGGKTTLLREIEALGGHIVDCDDLYHDLLENNGQLTEKLVNRFGNILTGGKIDRKKLGAVVFADPTALQDLNAIAHHFVSTAVMGILGENHPIIAIDAIGLHDSGLADLCNATICVVAPKKDRIKRLMLRENITEDYAKKRISAQKSDAEFMELCQYTLENNGSIAEFQAKCSALLSEILP